MRKRHEYRPILRNEIPPSSDVCRKPAFGALPKMPALGIKANQQHQFELWQMPEQAFPPAFSAFTARRPVAAFVVEAGKAEAHRDDRDAAVVVEFVRRHAHPVSQSVA